MAWYNPATWWTVGEIVTKAKMDAQIRDNLLYLKGLSGAVTTESDLTVPNLITAGNVDGVDVSAHNANTTTAHGAVSAATASKIVVRDAAARAAFAAPNAAGDALIKGTRVTTAELPALTDEKIWKGTGGDVEEVAFPTGVTIVRKTADQIVNNSTVLVNDTHLLFAVAASEIWEFLLGIRVYSTTATPDLKFAFTIPAAASSKRWEAWYSQGTEATELDGTVATYFFVSAASNQYKQLRYLYIGGANAGNVQFQWAQNTATVEDTKVLTNSFIIAHKLG